MEKLKTYINYKKPDLTSAQFAKGFGVALLSVLIACGGERPKHWPAHSVDAWAGIEDLGVPDLRITPDLSQGNTDMCTRVGQNACPCTKGEASCTWCGCFRNDAGDQPADINEIWKRCLQGDRDAKIFCDGLVQ